MLKTSSRRWLSFLLLTGAVACTIQQVDPTSPATTVDEDDAGSQPSFETEDGEAPAQNSSIGTKDATAQKDGSSSNLSDSGRRDAQEDARTDGPAIPTGEGSDPRILGIVAAHNQARAAATPTPRTPLKPLVWSDTDAVVARAYSKVCKWEHNPNRGPRGENLFATTGTGTPAMAMKSWVDEQADYNYATNTCAAGKICGHYTQVVWATSTTVGCAVNRCTTGSPFSGSSTWEFWVCDYSPPGNYVGQKPY